MSFTFTGRPRKSYPGRILLFIFFWASRQGYYVQHGYFFENVGIYFYAIKTGKLTPEFEFLNFFPHFFSKKQIIGVHVPVLIA